MTDIRPAECVNTSNENILLESEIASKIDIMRAPDIENKTTKSSANLKILKNQKRNTSSLFCYLLFFIVILSFKLKCFSEMIFLLIAIYI